MNLDLNDIRTMLATVLMGALGCTGIPEGLEPVRDFDSTRYLGTWYEVARLDHPFERGLEDVSARYTVKDDGGIRVVNGGMTNLRKSGARPWAKPTRREIPRWPVSR